MKPRGIPFINLIHKSAISIQIHFVLSVSLFPLICLLKKISLCIIRDIFQFINYSELNENEQYHNLNCTHINLRSHLNQLSIDIFSVGYHHSIFPVSSLSFQKKMHEESKEDENGLTKKGMTILRGLCALFLFTLSTDTLSLFRFSSSLLMA